VLACEPSGKITGTLSAAADEGFGRKVPHGTKGAKARPVPVAPINLRKSRLDRDFLSDVADNLSSNLDELVINLISVFLRNF
jgi:hypothetical protein